MDREEKLARLKQARAEEREAKELAEKLRDELLEDVKKDGQIYFVDEDGVKQRAYYSESDLTLVDIDALREAVRKRQLSKKVFDEVTKTVANTEQLKAAITTGRIPKSVVRNTMRVIPGGKSKTIKFGDPSDASSASSPDTR